MDRRESTLPIRRRSVLVPSLGHHVEDLLGRVNRQDGECRGEASVTAHRYPSTWQCYLRVFASLPSGPSG